jgi:cyclopropane fatty-acyl-phospholipid synthase-like methyltransferase
MFDELEEINLRPEPFQYYTAEYLWTDEHTSQKMLRFHLDDSVDISSRNREFIDRSVGWIVSHFRVDENTKIADFGCGPGLYTTQLAEKKAVVTGIDFSKRSIQYAKEAANAKGLKIDYINRNYLEFETEKKFDLIIMIMCDFCALSPNQRKVLLTKFHEFLEPYGSVLLDVYSIKAFEQRQETSEYELNLLDGFWSPEKYYGFLNTFKYEKEKVLLDKYTIVESDKKRSVFNWLQYFSSEELKKEFKACGFEITQWYSDVAGSTFDSESSEFAVVAQKC